MNEHEQQESEEPEDLEPSAEDAEQVVGGDGRVTTQPFTITKVVDKSSP